MHGRKFFLNVQKGSFSERTKPNEKTYSFTEVTGYLVNITFKSTEYGEAMRLHVIDEQNFYMLSMFVHSRPANAFFMMIKNVDLNEKVTFKISAQDGKDYFTIQQHGGPVLWYYTLENAHELNLASVQEKRAFLKDMVLTDIVPLLQKKTNPYPNNNMYVPSRKGLQGGYFDDFKNDSRVVCPVSRHERQDRKVFGNSRPL